MGMDIDQDIIPESKIALAASKMKSKMPQGEAVVEEEPMVEPEAMPEESAEPTGLMSRRV
jgi:hypothetical protein